MAAEPVEETGVIRNPNVPIGTDLLYELRPDVRLIVIVNLWLLLLGTYNARIILVCNETLWRATFFWLQSG